MQLLLEVLSYNLQVMHNVSVQWCTSWQAMLQAQAGCSGKYETFLYSVQCSDVLNLSEPVQKRNLELASLYSGPCASFCVFLVFGSELTGLSFSQKGFFRQSAIWLIDCMDQNQQVHFFQHSLPLTIYILQISFMAQKFRPVSV